MYIEELVLLSLLLNFDGNCILLESCEYPLCTLFQRVCS